MKRGGSVSGAVSLMMIFCVLCLVVFSVLTLSTAEREHRLSRLTADRAAAWYAADSTALRKVAALRNGETPEDVAFTETPEGTLAEFSVPITEEQTLSAAVQLSVDGSFKIVRWQTTYSGGWKADDSINVWDGDPMELWGGD